MNPHAACLVAAARAKPTDLFDEKGVLLRGIGRQSGLDGKSGGNDPRVTVLQEWKMDAGKAMTQRRMEDKERRTVVRRQQAGTAALGEREQNYGNKNGRKTYN